MVGYPTPPPRAPPSFSPASLAPAPCTPRRAEPGACCANPRAPRAHRSGSRLLTGEADKTIKVWKEDPDATPQTYPVNFVPAREPKKF
jgi:hypothetical protein